MKKWYTLTRKTTTRDRFDASATSLPNSMIRMPHKHHCLSLVSNDEARMREFDSRLASRCLSLNRGEQTHPIASRWYRLSFLFPSSALFLFFPLKLSSPLFHESFMEGWKQLTYRRSARYNSVSCREACSPTRRS